MDEDTPKPNPEHSRSKDSNSKVNEGSESAKKSLRSKKLNLKAILWDVTCLVAILLAIIFAKLWYTQSESQEKSRAEIVSNKKKIEGLEQVNKMKSETLAKTAKTYSKTYEKSAKLFTSKIESKENEITQLKSDLVKLNTEKLELDKHWRKPLKDALDISGDIYAMKWQVNSQVLADLENNSDRAIKICQKWEELCQSLEHIPELAPQVAKLEIRLAQAYSGLGLGYVNRINFEAIDWDVSGLSNQRHEIEAHVWYKVADDFIRSGKREESKKYSALAIKAAKSIKERADDAGKKNYYLAMTHLLEAGLIADSDPEKAMTSYLLACENLSKISIKFPTNSKVKDVFVQACADGALLGSSVNNAGNAEKLTKECYKKILALMGKYPEVKKYEGAIAEAKIHEAEECIKSGDHFKAQKALDEAKAIVKKSGGNALLSASIESTQAFIYWDHGQHTKALKIAGEAISNVKKLKSSDPQNQEISYGLASLYWARSSMRIQPAEAIEDGQTAVYYLVELVRSGAGKREAASRRMIAIIYSDIGEQAYTNDQKVTAKQYYTEAKKQWEYLSEKWGSTGEYEEGIKWCSRRIKSL